MPLGCRNYKSVCRPFILFVLSCHHARMDNTCSTSADYEVGKKLPHIPSKVVNQLGFMMCFRECEAYSFCLSINYNRKLLVCEFNNMKKNASTTLINDRDYMYKEIVSGSVFALSCCFRRMTFFFPFLFTNDDCLFNHMQ